MREHIPYGYKLWNGKSLNDHEVDRYNFLQDRINAFEATTMPTPEWLLNDAHAIIAHGGK